MTYESRKRLLTCHKILALKRMVSVPAILKPSAGMSTAPSLDFKSMKKKKIKSSLSATRARFGPPVTQFLTLQSLWVYYVQLEWVSVCRKAHNANLSMIVSKPGLANTRFQSGPRPRAIPVH